MEELRGSGWIRRLWTKWTTTEGVAQQLSVWQMEGERERGREGVRQWTTRGHKADKKGETLMQNLSNLTLILPDSFFITHPFFPPFLAFPALFQSRSSFSSSTSSHLSFCMPSLSFLSIYRPFSFTLSFCFLSVLSLSTVLLSSLTWPFCWVYLHAHKKPDYCNTVNQVTQEIRKCICMHCSNLVTVKSVFTVHAAWQ